MKTITVTSDDIADQYIIYDTSTEHEDITIDIATDTSITAATGDVTMTGTLEIPTALATTAIEEPSEDWLVWEAGDTEWSPYLTVESIRFEAPKLIFAPPDEEEWTLTVKNGKLIAETQNQEYIFIPQNKEVVMWSISNILFVALIAFVVFKLAPKLTLRRFFRMIFRLVIRPFKRAEKQVFEEARNVKMEWDLVDQETEED